MAATIEPYKATAAWVFCPRRCFARRLVGGETVKRVLVWLCEYCESPVDVVQLAARAEIVV